MQRQQYVEKCRYYAQGRCIYGNDCRFSHQGFRQIYIMRHAESIFNSFCQKLQGYSFTSQKAKIQFQLNPDIIDCGITQKGKQQAKNIQLPSDCYRLKKKKNQQQLINVKYIDLVFVSPLNRALQTAQIVLKKNKIRSKKIIVLPQLTEVLSKVCDFSQPIQNKKKNYNQFDFSYFDESHQSLQSKSNHFWQDLLLDQHHHSHLLQRQKHGTRYMKILDYIFPTPLESSQRCFQRTILALKKIQYIAKKQQAKKILIVSHNRILKYICGRQNAGRAPSLQNCQIRKIMLEQY